jgi:transposase
VSKKTKGFDAGKKINGRKTFGVADTLGLLMAVVIVAASTSDNVGGITVANRARDRSARFAQLWCDSGFKRTFIEHCRNHHVGVEVVNRIHPSRFEVLPKRWIVERTWSWLMNSRRLQVDYERDPIVTEGFIWAAHTQATSCGDHPIADRVIALGKQSRQSLSNLTFARSLLIDAAPAAKSKPKEVDDA